MLEFAEFLKIEGCTTGNHLFLGSKKDEVGWSLSKANAGTDRRPVQGGDRLMPPGPLSNSDASACFRVRKRVDLIEFLVPDAVDTLLQSR